MMLRSGLFALVIALLAGGFALRGAFDGDHGPRPDPQAAQRATSASEIAILEQRVRDRPGDAPSLARLGALYLLRLRETGGPSFYALADSAVQRALVADPDDVGALAVAGNVALAKHDFARALAIGERLRGIGPDIVAAYGILTDAYVELGRYEEALAAAQEMIDRRPDFASYSRASYIRELYGDVDGAIELMELAAAAGTGVEVDEAWARVLLGNLHLTRGDVDAAATEYEHAAQILPDDALTAAGLARLAVAQGRLDEAEALLRRAVDERPLPEYAIALGDLLWSQGREVEAEEQYALVWAIQGLLAESGVDVDLELAVFDVDHAADPQVTYSLARSAYERRPGIYAADALAWAAHAAGRTDEAQAYMTEALRLGTRDPRLEYHAGVIARAAGDEDAARRHFSEAVAMQPAQSLRYANAASKAALVLRLAQAGAE